MKFFIIILCTFIFAVTSNATNNWYRGLFRVNTDLSSGNESIETVVEKAKADGMKFVVFSDQFIVIAEYGLPPFRNIFKLREERKSIVSYGITDYLDEIRQVQKKYPDIVLVPGADIAPHYYWKGNYLKGTLATYRWSEQLTVFGNWDPDFYRKLPVVLNNRTGFTIYSLLKLLPLFLSIIGLISFTARKKTAYYSDIQGHSYYRHKKLRSLFAIFLIAAGILWTLNNKPFTIKGSSFDIYRDHGTAPFQEAINYVRKNGGSKTGIIWSAPEAEMKDKINGVFLYTAPYLNDVENTHGYNGFAGIYADASHAHEPGKTWDKLLTEYCSGKRKIKPIIVGEADYHGRGSINLIQTVIDSDKTDYTSVVNAIIQGNSYAAVHANGKMITLDDAKVVHKNMNAGLGQELNITDNGKITLEIKGHLELDDKKAVTFGKIFIVQDGKLLYENKMDLKNFSLNQDIVLTNNELEKHYVRFYIFADNVWLLANPIFIKTRR